MLRAFVIAAGAALIVFAGAVPAQALSPPGNRIVNPGAEMSALDGWLGSGFISAAYGSAERYPSLDGVAARFYGDGTQLFAAVQGGAQITQTIDLGDLAASGGAGQRPRLVYGGDFGAQGASQDTSRIIVQLQDGAGLPIGAPQIVGQPTAADRDNQTTLLNCVGSIDVPPGTSTARLTLQAMGAAESNTAMADSLFLTSEPVAIPAISESTVPAQGPGCRTSIPKPLPSPSATGQGSAASAGRLPKLTSLLVLPVAQRCGKARMLRFRVTSSWRSKVRQVTLTARGRRLHVAPDRSTVLRGPAHRLLVRFSVRLKDGRTRIGARRFVGCGNS